MKQIGTTPSGGAIVELSPAGQAILKDALRASEGLSFPSSMTRQFQGLPDGDISKLFIIMFNWMQVRFAINHARAILDDFQNVTNGEKA